MSSADPHQPVRPSSAPAISRRHLLALGVGAGAALPLGAIAALAVPGGRPPLDFPICDSSLKLAAVEGPAQRTALTVAWNPTAICTAAAPVAKEAGFFEKNNLDVSFVSFGSSTEQLLESIATGKADAGLGMALRWLKPLEQGFDVKITAGIHGGCMRLIGSQQAGTTTLQSLKGKVIAVSDQASPDKNFFSIVLAKNGIDPINDVEWRQYPLDLLALAVQKGEAQALTAGDPLAFLWRRDPGLVEIANNLSGEYAHRTCCVIGIRGSLLRSNKPAAAALTRAFLEAGNFVAEKPDEAVKIYAKYGMKGSPEDLAAMLKSHTHHDHPLGADLKGQIADYAKELKTVNVFKPSTDTAKFADRVYADVLS
ncbi:ABC transporter substrate-binding protein [Chelatococcus reniformis]|uniref:ABC transporter substrate-binding protein n=1 Tax=Chelatococcus reniformis TaxID=1494448 RepID=A0A916X7Z5_9HYPH|nr:ABC transporter substrate-binding protein [Chelatococcus reniformis]GGC49419.1 ABC transporter substrate-binding protein [Chelatococcus reniformis]